MSFQIRPTAGYRRGAVSMSCRVNLLQSLIERRPEKAKPDRVHRNRQGSEYVVSPEWQGLSARQAKG
jgi:hypothetical protein